MRLRARKKWTPRRGKWLVWSRDRRRGVPERYCPECNRAYDVTPRPKEDDQLLSRSAAAMVYSTSRNGRTEFKVRFGRWQAYGNDLCLSGLFGPEDLEDLEKVVVMAGGYIRRRTACPPKSSLLPARRQTAIPRQ